MDMESPDGQSLKGDEDDDQIVSTLGEIGEKVGNYINTFQSLLNKSRNKQVV